MNERLAKRRPRMRLRQLAYDAEPPQLTDGVRDPNSQSPSVLTLTCLENKDTHNFHPKSAIAVMSKRPIHP